MDEARKLGKPIRSNIRGHRHTSNPDASARLWFPHSGTWLRTATEFNVSSRVVVFTSAFKRTLDTTAAITRELRQRPEVIVHPEIFETGGVYTDGVGGTRVGPGKCMSATEIATLFGYTTSRLPSVGQWYTSGWEPDGESRKRAGRVAQWLTSTGFRAEVGEGSLVVMVTHAHFIDHLSKALLRIPDDPTLDPPKKNDPGKQAIFFATPNTATTLLQVTEHGQVVVRWVNRVDHLGNPVPKL